MTTAFTSVNFSREVLSSDKPVLVDFWAPWCGPCRMLGPIVDQLAHELAGTHVIGKVNVDDEPALAQAFDISSIPALIVFRGGKPVTRAVGFQSPAQLKRLLESSDGATAAR